MDQDLANRLAEDIRNHFEDLANRP